MWSKLSIAALHDLETITPAGIDSIAVSGDGLTRSTRQSAADAIAAQATGHIDFPAVVDRAYDDGVRVFLEVGPGSSCTRLIGEILGERPHLACSACRPDAIRWQSSWTLLGELIAHRVPVDLACLYGRDDVPSESPKSPRMTTNGVTFRIPVRERAFQVPVLSSRPHQMQTRLVSICNRTTTSAGNAHWLAAHRYPTIYHRCHALSPTRNEPRPKPTAHSCGSRVTPRT